MLYKQSNLSSIKEKSIEYCNYYTQILYTKQKFTKQNLIEKLVFAPIGSNILHLGNALHRALKQNKRLVISPGSSIKDRKFVQKHNKQFCSNHKIEPWILQRYDNNYDEKNPWNIWFKDLAENESETLPGDIELLKIQRRLQELRKTLGNHATLLEWAICVDYVTHFNSTTLNYLFNHKIVNSRESATVHVRRGDACSEDLQTRDPFRNYHDLNVYINHMQAFYKNW